MNAEQTNSRTPEQEVKWQFEFLNYVMERLRRNCPALSVIVWTSADGTGSLPLLDHESNDVCWQLYPNAPEEARKLARFCDKLLGDLRTAFEFEWQALQAARAGRDRARMPSERPLHLQ